MSAMSDLMAHVRQTEALGQVMGRLAWDQETMMPAGATPQRAEESAALARVLHARRTDPRLGEWLAAAEPQDEVEARQIELIARDFARSIRVPETLAAAIAALAPRAQAVWAAARAGDDMAAFRPLLSETLELQRERGSALAEGGDPYDALLQEFEPDATAAELDAMFGALRPRLVALRERILGVDAAPDALTGRFGRDGQLAISRELARAFGYDETHGRIDLAVHPFSSGSGLDVRITTRVAEKNPFDCIYSTIHETGHATYEQNVARDFLLTPMGRGVSMGVHESQSRLYENQLGRSRAFCGWLRERMARDWPGAVPEDADAFWATVNRVEPGFIRTEADEVHYNLHVLLRFDLERELIAGRLDVADLEAAWNARFTEDFGCAVDRPSNGCLQDVHWSVGGFGYFPTYTIGNVYAGCLHAALRRDLPDLDASLAEGDPSPATAWLAEKVQATGALYPAAETIARATGEAPSEGPLLDYLEAKFAAIYRL